MKKTIAIFVLIIIICYLLAIIFFLHRPSRKEKVIIPNWNPVISRIKGECVLAKNGAKKPVKGVPGMKIGNGDTVSTNSESKMLIMMNKRDFLLLGKETRIVVLASLNKDSMPDIKIMAMDGKLHADVEVVTENGGFFNIISPDINIKNRHTAYTVEVNKKKKETKVSVIRGEVEVKHKKTKQKLSVGKGKKIAATKTKMAEKAKKIEKDEIKDVLSWINSNSLEIGGEVINALKSYRQPVVETARKEKVEINENIRKHLEELDETIKESTPQKEIKRKRTALSPVTEAADEWKDTRAKRIANEYDRARTEEQERHQRMQDEENRSPREILKVINSNIGALTLIYQRHLRKGDYFSGKILLEFSILPDGSIAGTKVISASTNDETFENDIIERVSQIKFRPVHEDLGSLKIKYPFEFQGR